GNICSHEASKRTERRDAASGGRALGGGAVGSGDRSRAWALQTDRVLSPATPRGAAIGGVRQAIRLGRDPRVLRRRTLDDAVHGGVWVQPKRVVGRDPPRRDLTASAARANRRSAQAREAAKPPPPQAQIA